MAFTLQHRNDNTIKPIRKGTSSSTKTTSSSSLTAHHDHNDSDSDPKDAQNFINRRSILLHTRNAALTLSLAGLTSTTTSPQAAHATLMDNTLQNSKTFKLGEKLSPDEAKQRFLDALTETDELIENYASISSGGGDAVRRYLGTVGVDKKMYGITKVVKELREEAEDIVEYTEIANEFEAYLYQAEGAAYQSLFVEHSSAKGTPESFLATAKKDVISMRKYMGELKAQLNL